MKWRQQVLIEWRGPKEAKTADWQSTKTELRPALYHLPIVVGILLLVSWWLLRTYFPQIELDWADVAGRLAVLAFGIIGFVLLDRLLPNRYWLTDLGLSWRIGGHVHAVSWNQIEEVFLYQHPTLPRIPLLKLKLKAKRWATLTLPPDETSTKICALIRERVPAFIAGEPPQVERPLMDLPTESLMVFICLIGIYLFGLEKFLQHVPLSHNTLFLAMGVSMILGPGTWGAALLAKFQWKSFRRLIPWGGLFNVVTLPLAMVMAAIHTTMPP